MTLVSCQQSGVPGIEHTYGVSKNNKLYEPAHKGLPPEEIWDTHRYMNFVPALFEKVRETYGDDIHLLHDVHHRCTPIEAARLAKELDPFDYIRMPLVHGGGITHLLKVAAMASVYHINTGFHGATDLSPVNLAAAIHFNMAVNNFGILEYMPHQEIVNEVFKTNYRFEDGYLVIDDSPGIGVDIDEKAASKFSYTMARLPVNRKTDGTMFNW